MDVEDVGVAEVPQPEARLAPVEDVGVAEDPVEALQAPVEDVGVAEVPVEALRAPVEDVGVAEVPVEALRAPEIPVEALAPEPRMGGLLVVLLDSYLVLKCKILVLSDFDCITFKKDRLLTDHNWENREI